MANQHSSGHSLKQAQAEVDLVNHFLKEGFPPKGMQGKNNSAAATSKAAEVLRCDRLSLKKRVGEPGRAGVWKKLYKIEPDWSLYKEPDPTFIVEDHVTKRRERDLSKENQRLSEALADAVEWRKSIMKLVEDPPKPVFNEPDAPKKKGERTIILHLSDLHCGERVSMEQMDGLNKFDVEIFKRRLDRLTATVRDLVTLHWKGQPPARLKLILGGDMISGEIHEELAKTNDALAAPAVRACAERIAGLVTELSKIFRQIDVYTVPGNHGRLTKKPESKGMAINSFDTLVSNVVEMAVKLSGVKNVDFFYSQSGDILMKVYHVSFAVVHGDRIGSRGGTGFIGPMATILRGVHKTRAYYASQGIMIDYVLVGHFHTSGWVPQAFSNGSLVGPSEYSRDLRAVPEPASQNMITVHSDLGIVDYKKIYCGHPSEGSIYRGL